MVRRPSLHRPTGMPKNVWPKGSGNDMKRADIPPVSELESPKLKIAGKLQSACALRESCSTSIKGSNVNLVVADVVER